MDTSTWYFVRIGLAASLLWTWLLCTDPMQRHSVLGMQKTPSACQCPLLSNSTKLLRWCATVTACGRREAADLMHAIRVQSCFPRDPVAQTAGGSHFFLHFSQRALLAFECADPQKLSQRCLITKCAAGPSPCASAVVGQVGSADVGRRIPVSVYCHRYVISLPYQLRHAASTACAVLRLRNKQLIAGQSSICTKNTVGWKPPSCT